MSNMDGPDVPPARQARQEAFWGQVDVWIRGRIGQLLTAVLTSEQNVLLQANWNQRAIERTGYRNGFYRRRLTTPHGLLDVQVPRCRHGGMDCSMLFDRYQRRLPDVDRILLHAYLTGSSTRATAELAEQVFGGSLSHQTVSQLSRWLDDQLAAWREQPIQPIYRCLFIDGMHVNVLDGDRQVMLVTGLTRDGRHEVLGFALSRGEQCKELLWDLRRRGLKDMDLLVGDQSAAIRAAMQEVFPEVPWQHCVFHRLQALERDIGQQPYRWQMVKQAARVFRCPSKAAAVDRAVAWAKQWREHAPWAVQRFMEDITNSLMFYCLPKDWWRRTRTNNKLERLIRTLRMRLNNIGCFHDAPAVERAVFGQLLRWHLVELTHTT